MNEARLPGRFLAGVTGDHLPLGLGLTASLFATACSCADGEGGCHGPDHTARVHNTALYIGRELRADLVVLSAAALLHDIGRRLETEKRGRVCHAAIGAELARDILAGQGFPADRIEAVAACIATHRYRRGAPPVSLEAKILYDADKLDSIGAIGIGRAFLFAGQIGARLHNSDGNIDNTEPYSVDDTAYREFRIKMCRIKDRMLTPIGRHLAQERHAFMETFFRRLDQEIGEHPGLTCGA